MRFFKRFVYRNDSTVRKREIHLIAGIHNIDDGGRILSVTSLHRLTGIFAINHPGALLTDFNRGRHPILSIRRNARIFPIDDPMVIVADLNGRGYPVLSLGLHSDILPVDPPVAVLSHFNGRSHSVLGHRLKSGTLPVDIPVAILSDRQDGRISVLYRYGLPVGKLYDMAAFLLLDAHHRGPVLQLRQQFFLLFQLRFYECDLFLPTIIIAGGKPAQSQQ